MKDRLESFIADNKDQFDLYEPSEKVWENLNGRKRKSGISMQKISFYLIRIAAVMLIFIASYAFHEYMDYREMARNESPDNAIYKAGFRARNSKLK
jgi:hypothetical protein